MSLPVDQLARTHPVRLVVTDDLSRRRITVAFRLLLAVPHLLWVTLFGIAAFALSFVVWIAVLVEGRAPRTLHGFLASYTRYTVHLTAYLCLAADPYPGFTGAGPYPVDVEIAPPSSQGRVGAAFRLLLAIPAVMLSSALGGSAAAGAVVGGSALGGSVGLATVVGILGWFASLAVGRMPRGMRDAAVFAVRYCAQTTAYLLLLTERYPDSAPGAGPSSPLPAHPVELEVDDDLRRPRLLVLFRAPLVVPHLLWLACWSVLGVAAAVAAWVCALALGRVPLPLHRFLAAYVRARFQVISFLFLIGRPFPGFVGREDSYPVHLKLASPTTQGRLGALFRLPLAVPALLLSLSYLGVALVVAVLGWFASLATARMPVGLRDLGAVALRYEAQASAYVFLLTPRYPYASPALRDRPRHHEIVPGEESTDGST